MILLKGSNCTRIKCGCCDFRSSGERTAAVYSTEAGAECEKEALPQTLPEEWRCWQVLQAEEGTKSHLPQGLRFLSPWAAFGPELSVAGNLLSMLEEA